MESRSDKATSAMPFSSGTGVNRRLREALSHGDKRRRNETPYQAGSQKYNDSRRFQPRYEPRSAQDYRYDGKKHMDDKRYLDYDEHEDHANKRQRTRSRSPEPLSSSRYQQANAEPAKNSRSWQEDKNRHQLSQRSVHGGNEARDARRNHAESSAKREQPLTHNFDVKQHAKAPFESKQHNVRSMGSVDGHSK